MTDRTKATSITTKMRTYIHERDQYCIHCGNTQGLTIAHAYVNRSHGGKGIKENLCLLCIECHHFYDNGMYETHQQVKKSVHSYMESLYGKPNYKKITYKKGELE